METERKVKIKFLYADDNRAKSGERDRYPGRINTAAPQYRLPFRQ